MIKQEIAQQQGWRKCRLGHLFKLKHGYAFKSKYFSNNGPFILLTPGNFYEGGGFRSKGNQEKYYTGDFPPEYILKHRDLLIAMTEQAPGLLGSAILIPEDTLCLHNQRLGLVNDLNEAEIDRVFLYHLFNYHSVRAQIHATASGTKVRHTSPSRIYEVEVLLPPLLEQRAVATILDTWDEAIALTGQLIAAKQQRKKALMQQLLTGKRRFNEFQEEPWKKFEFLELFESVSARRYQVKKSEYADTGKYPVVDQGQQLIAGYSNFENVFNSVPVIVFGDHTRILKWIDFPFVIGADGTQLLTTKEPCDLLFGYYLLHTARIPNLGYSRHFKVLKGWVFSIPTSENEQRKIAAVMRACDTEIDLLSQKLAALQRQKKGLMQQLLTGRTRVKV